MRDHIARWHPKLAENTAGSSTTSNQTTIPNTITKLPMHSEKALRITKSIGAFIAKDLRPYSVVENDGFLAMLRTLERRYVVSCRSHFRDVVIPTLYKDAKIKVEESYNKRVGLQ